MYYKNILEVIGNTPLVKINKLNPNPKVVMLAKLEFMNPGGSIKDRIGLPLIERAEKMGRLKKGGTIVEPTSGNTGVGLAMVAAVRGYKTVFVMPDKMSEEKRNLLRAYGSKVVVTPTAVSPEDERSYYRVSDKIASENSNSYKPDQYSNPANPETHYRTTGLEIWEQTEGKITHVVIGMGTGGTISGVGKYLKKKNPKIKIIGVDPVGSGYDHYYRTGKMPKLFKTYKVEGIGEDFLPETMDFSVVDDVVVISDKESFLIARQLAGKEGILAGGSSGLALAAARKVIRKLKTGLMVVILPDSGKNYLSKFYNDDWMRDFGFLDEKNETIKKLLNKKLHFITVQSAATPAEAVKLMRQYQISQLPVVENKKVVGTLTESILIKSLYGNSKIPVSVAEIMDRDFISLPETASETQLAQALKEKEMVIITDKQGKPLDVLTRIDFLSNFSV
ncbi:cystathionine beta-synthase [Candidatus Gottesmanbacteria bacterium RIFCSPLOWO2_02_FULL_42_29]|uniref:Cystathionine beta-synthase n=2 Tax=Candidatus Gottesmaniibacteriota TaxID=1752720 RepID=A0A0G0ZFQ3_9BACT|nr:MAG: Cystathionine beta-synthase [Candidatus Gottesmanbacteria bacterium GW2011_GWA2_42_18]KKS76286.1 MAG: Cystathionine beta-synthase [Candidatus Gottesmanbacteria bacterium GW2011_GWC2_42_8]OGG12276.1 MAG: cystathionine beta-synthase [Candidatus Gottesmanbacteria bacterium RIFCSPHIGHO2_01_FULL_42_27]OGG21106.1 MAG: cystathionine beta-synthase [Candidatus Gottesmanbacteria bacterium RIFCSPHIGHO2_12_FULL_43_26]OGG35525.1 MAG: cystathionine beta-synthase [Candidatus Gottesmanbacteria bacteriu